MVGTNRVRIVENVFLQRLCISPIGPFYTIAVSLSIVTYMTADQNLPIVVSTYITTTGAVSFK